MKDITFNGPQDGLRLPSGRVIRRGVRSEVTDEDADYAGRSPHDVTVHEDAGD